MKRRVLCSFIVVVMLFALCVMCACDDNGNGNDNAKQVSLKEGMTLKELHDFFETVTSFGYCESETDVFREYWTEKGMCNIMVDDWGYPEKIKKVWEFYEDGRRYNISCSYIKDTNEELSSNILIDDISKEEYEEISTIKTMLNGFIMLCEDGWEWHIEGNKLVMGDDAGYTYILFGFNTTELFEIPQQYKNYKDLPTNS